MVEDDSDLARTGADLVADAIAGGAEVAVVAATGRTPMGMYAELAARRRSGLVDTGGITAFQLDEYLGLGPDDRRSLLGWMRESFLDPLRVPDDRVVRLPVDGDLEEACAAFDRALEARGGLDLAILGLGTNGHLGFNEPPSAPDAPTRAVDLSPATIRANARYWGDVVDVPARAVTMGMRQLLSARKIVVAVSGRAKRTILRRVLEGRVEPDVPASLLRLSGSNVIVIADRAAWSDG